MNLQLLIPAAGSGTRLGGALPKALVDVCGKPLLVRTLSRFEPLDLVDNSIVTVPEAYCEQFDHVLRHFFPSYSINLIPGGTERQISVANGLAALDDDCEVVVIHDAARPFVPRDAIEGSIRAAADCGAASVAIPSIDTILVSDADGYLVETPDRRSLWACQTPQTFRVEVIREAHAWAKKKDVVATDDATLVRRAGGRVKLVMGSPANMKITTPHDMVLAESVIKEGLA